jgi:hypothetical protein
MAPVKTTLDLPDDLMREVKLRAVNENRRIKDVVAEALRRGLDAPSDGDAVRHRVRLPLVQCAHAATVGQELGPDVVADVLVDQEVTWHAG